MLPFFSSIGEKPFVCLPHLEVGWPSAPTPFHPDGLPLLFLFTTIRAPQGASAEQTEA